MALPAHRPLAAAIGLLLLLPLQTLAQQVVADGVTLRPPGDTYMTTAPVDGDSTAGYAFYALNAGGINPLGPVLLVTQGHGAAAARAQGQFSLINLAGGNVHTFGEGAAGLSTSDGGHIRAVAGDVEVLTNGVGSHAAHASRSSLIEMYKTVLETYGRGSHGVLAETGSVVGMTGGRIRVYDQREGDGVQAHDASVTLRDVDIQVYGGHGIVATQDARIDGEGVKVIVRAPGRYGVDARQGAEIHLSASQIDALGDGSVGVGVGGIANLKNTHIAVQGADAWAAMLSDGGTLMMEGGSLVSDKHGAIWARSGGQLAFADGAQLIGGNGTLLAVDAEIGGQVNIAMDRGASGYGDIVISSQDIDSGVPVTAQVHMQLEGGSSWQGATNIVGELSLKGDSVWRMSADSTVKALLIDNAIIMLSSPDAGGFNTLTVNGDLDTTGGRFLFNAALAGDRSPADLLHVKGGTRGTADVQVNNLGGAGGYTVEGIQLIRVDGASDAVFSLSGRAVAGQNEYFLFKGGKADPADGGWYLRSELPVAPPEPDPCLADPNAPGCVITLPEQCLIDPSLPQCLTPVPVLRPEPGAYLANQSAATEMFGMRMHDRNGGTTRGLSERGAWARVSRNQADYGVIGDQLSVNGDTDVLQVGTDVFAWGEGSRGQLGVMLGSGRANNTVTSRLTRYSAKGKVDGQAIGIYASWLQDTSATTGLYVDAWANHAQFKNSVQGDALNKERYDSKANSASVEAGYGFQVANGERVAMFVEPQIQLSYTRFSSDNHIESNGTVIDDSDADGLTSRVGVRFFGHANTVLGNRVQPFMSVNWIHESSDSSLRFDGERVVGGLPQDRYELRGGAEVRLSKHWGARGDLGWQRGGGYRDMTGQLALLANW